MAKYMFVVYSNPVKGREDEYNDWYENIHLDEVIAQPGFIGAQRFALEGEPFQGAKPAQRYLCLYEIETDDPSATMNNLRVAADSMNVSSALDRGPSIGILYKAIGPRHG